MPLIPPHIGSHPGAQTPDWAHPQSPSNVAPGLLLPPAPSVTQITPCPPCQPRPRPPPARRDSSFPGSLCPLPLLHPPRYSSWREPFRTVTALLCPAHLHPHRESLPHCNPGLLPSSQTPFSPLSSSSPPSSFLPQGLCTWLFPLPGVPRDPQISQAGSCCFLLNIQTSGQDKLLEKPSRPDSQIYTKSLILHLISSITSLYTNVPSYWLICG